MKKIAVPTQQIYCESSHSFSHSPFSNHLLNGYHIPGHVLGTRNTLVNKTEKRFLLFWSLHGMEGVRITNQQINTIIWDSKSWLTLAHESRLVCLSSHLHIQQRHVDSLNHRVCYSGGIYTMETGKYNWSVPPPPPPLPHYIQVLNIYQNMPG